MTGVQTCALPICDLKAARARASAGLQNAPTPSAPATPIATKRWNPQTGQLEEIK